MHFYYDVFVLINQVSANSIKSIDMDVYIDNNGNATVTEIWNANLTQGTEGYRPYTKMGNSVISNFSVTDQTGTTYQSLSNWNTSASFSSKAYKNGIHTISNGVELCWGISKINAENTSLYTKTLSVGMVSALARETLRYERRTEREARRRARKMARQYSYSGSDRDSGGGGSSYSSGGSSSGGSSGGGFR